MVRTCQSQQVKSKKIEDENVPLECDGVLDLVDTREEGHFVGMLLEGKGTQTWDDGKKICREFCSWESRRSRHVDPATWWVGHR